MKMAISALLLLLVHIHVSAGSLVSVFRQTEGSITLEFQQHQQLERRSVGSVVWKIEKYKVLTYIPNTEAVKIFRHEDRVVFNKETFSLELKNLQKNDSGLYSGEIIAGELDLEAEYRLSVLDPVRAPVLSNVSYPSCGNFSNVTVTCRGHDLYLTSTCNSSTCYPEGKASSGSVLTLSVRDNVITCKHSNQVSWSDVTIDINYPSYSGREAPPAPNGALMSGIITCIVFILACGCYAAKSHWRRKQRKPAKTETVENPIYTSAEQLSVSTDGPTYSVVKKNKSAESNNLMV